MSDWRTIGTAPRDGTVVLGYFPGGLSPDAKGWNEDDAGIEVFPMRWIWDGWHSCITECDHGVYDDPSHDRVLVEIEPTHWQPVPSPPDTEKGMV